MDLTDAQWEQLAPVFETPYKGTGRPRQDARPVLNGILWIVRTGAPWKDLPERYPPHQTCHRRYQEWVDQGFFDLAQDLLERGQIDVKECFIDGSFAPSKKKGSGVGKTPASFIGMQKKEVTFVSMSQWPELVDEKYQRPKEQWWMNLREIAKTMNNPPEGVEF